jgi:Na+-driven multidrug efflux pump
MACNVIIGASVTIFYIIFRESVIRLFIDDAEVISYGVKMLTAIMTPGAVLGIMFIINFAFQGMGKGLNSLILAASRQGLIYLPLLFIMDHLVGLEGIIWAQPTADFACIILSIFMFAHTIKKLNKKATLK